MGARLQAQGAITHHSTYFERWTCICAYKLMWLLQTSVRQEGHGKNLSSLLPEHARNKTVSVANLPYIRGWAGSWEQPVACGTSGRRCQKGGPEETTLADSLPLLGTAFIINICAGLLPGQPAVRHCLPRRVLVVAGAGMPLCLDAPFQ